MRAWALAPLVASALLLAGVDAHAQCRGRPTDPAGFQGYSYEAAEVRSFATADVRVHYAISGKHAPNLATTRADTVPDLVAFAAETGQDALTRFGQMGFRKPPTDQACTSNGGDGKLDIYLVGFAGADGTTVPECTTGTCGSFVLSDATFSGRGYPSVKEGFRTVVVHELFHAVQNAYDPELERFWAEGTAQWAMKTLHPELVDFERQLPPFFAEPSRSLDTQPSGVTAGYLYGSAVWPLFLTLKYGPETVREMLEAEATGQKTLVATDAVLKTKGSSLAEAFPLFAAWNAATKTRAGTGGYPDAAKYPGIKATALVDGAASLTAGLSYAVYEGTLDAPSKISLETDPARNAGVLVPLEDGKARIDKATPLPANGTGSVLVVVAGITSKKTDAPFTVRIGPADPAVTTPAGPTPVETSDDGGCRMSPAHAPTGTLALVAMLATLAWRRRRIA